MLIHLFFFVLLGENLFAAFWAFLTIDNAISYQSSAIPCPSLMSFINTTSGLFFCMCLSSSPLARSVSRFGVNVTKYDSILPQMLCLKHHLNISLVTSLICGHMVTPYGFLAPIQ